MIHPGQGIATQPEFRKGTGAGAMTWGGLGIPTESESNSGWNLVLARFAVHYAHRGNEPKAL